MKLKQRFGRVLMASAMLGAGWSAAAQATTLEISITNTAQAGGFAITRPYRSAVYGSDIVRLSADAQLLATTGGSSFRIWDALLREGPRDAPWIPPILEQIQPEPNLLGDDAKSMAMIVIVVMITCE